MHTHLRRTAATMAAVSAISLLAACGLHQSTQPDCTSELNYSGTVYTATKFTKIGAHRLGQGIQMCSGHVTGGPKVTVWKFPGQPAADAVGVKKKRSTTVIYIANTVSRTESIKILQSLRASS